MKDSRLVVLSLVFALLACEADLTQDPDRLPDADKPSVTLAERNAAPKGGTGAFLTRLAEEAKAFDEIGLPEQFEGLIRQEALMQEGSFRAVPVSFTVGVGGELKDVEAGQPDFGSALLNATSAESMETYRQALRETAVAAVSRAGLEWEPAQDNGQPVRQRLSVPVVFGLEGQSAEGRLATFQQAAAADVLFEPSADSRFVKEQVDAQATPQGGYEAYKDRVRALVDYPEDLLPLVEAFGKDSEAELVPIFELIVDKSGRMSEITSKAAMRGSHTDKVFGSQEQEKAATERIRAAIEAAIRQEGSIWKPAELDGRPVEQSVWIGFEVKP